MEFVLPPRLTNDSGAMRRVGVELEFAGLGVEEAAGAVHDCFGGRLERCGAHRFMVEDTAFGEFEVELDSIYAHPASWHPDTDSILKDAKQLARAALGDVISEWMPREIVGPPMSLRDLPRMDELVALLRARGAVGTDAKWRYAFGMQLNPEAPSLECPEVLEIFRAYLLLNDWLRDRAARDPLRKLLAFIQPFDRQYALRVLDRDYRPGWDAFIDDYLEANPTRNRDLDMCPLFASVDEERVRSRLDDPRIKARPAFHYRIPDSRVEDAQWSIVGEWNRWVLVEQLAADRPSLQELSRMFRDRFADGPMSEWIEETDRWITGRRASHASA